MRYLLLIAAILLIPYNLLPVSVCGAILLLICSIYLLKIEKNLIVNQYIFYSILFLNVIAILSLIYSKNINLFFDGFITYLAVLLFYLLFTNLHMPKVLDYFAYITSISAFIFIIFQGLILNKRIDGTFGYANTYGLLLLIGLYMNEIRTEQKFKSSIQWVLILGILLTESRNTFIYLFIFALICYFAEYKEKNYRIAINFFTTIIFYGLVKYFGLGTAFVIPVFYIPLYHFYNKSGVKIKKQISLFFAIAIVVSLSLLVFGKFNFNTRVSNISLDSGSLQERFIYYEDCFQSIIKNPLGSGINSFVYKQYKNQSAFYDIKYIHNSLLQVCYDMGILGLAAFMFIFIYGVYMILKSEKDRLKVLKLAMFLTIYFHSLLDFDFSFTSIFIIVVMIMSFLDKRSSFTIRKSVKMSMIILGLIISVYILIINSLVFLGNIYAKNDINKSVAFYRANKAITIRNPDIYVLMAQAYRGNNMYKECLANLKLAEQVNNEDPRIKMNIAFTYERLGDIENTIKYFDIVLSYERYYPEIYKSYYLYLDSIYKNTKNHSYKVKMDNLRELYYKNYCSLNKKSIFLRNQLENNLNYDIKN
ncbi:O-antigen ligase family protein [Clostridium sp. OS1-26]|uniref:O-antigen ligase family protein n=1 Tax=Clostridium sp. OS1-26 TaxID=3070681 RepID=UPI0027E209CF|nr:O-antigen ligase family protein [Clostridium sp. OS1-26]WML33090.1 O-antigen ligase family protein [Clostridium sp. OS1-26]